MKLAKTFVMVACAILLSVGGNGSARQAYAQDAASTDVQGWSAGGTGSADLESAAQSSPAAQEIPLAIGGCWSGDVSDDLDGSGTAALTFVQKGKKFPHSSRLNFDWPDTSYVHGAIHGTISSTGIKFNGKAGKGCPFHGVGTGDASLITGTVRFTGKCAKFFTNVSFSISPGC